MYKLTKHNLYVLYVFIQFFKNIHCILCFYLGFELKTNALYIIPNFISDVFLNCNKGDIFLFFLIVFNINLWKSVVCIYFIR